MNRFWFLAGSQLGSPASVGICSARALGIVR